jgi:hypothetical protein
MSNISVQAFRQRAIDKQREGEARVQMLQRSIAATRALDDANAKCVGSRRGRAVREALYCLRRQRSS